MKCTLVLLTLFLFGCASKQPPITFDLKIESVFDSYEYSTHTYIKELCIEGTSYSNKIKLTNSQIENIINEAHKIEFFSLSDYIEHEGEASVIENGIEKIQVCAPCPDKKLFLKIADRSHTITWSCNCSSREEPTPKVLDALIALIESPIHRSTAYKSAPESMCRLR
ncbi:hypothetical protein [Pseudoalteromonas sp. H105]|jgi:hypothetical protein|uniref:hypothetical protein n=1 Tax=Pseudoalteromonas sp. H105 TaxID=1348393 RepID=UPI0007322780|nr:hypothetical protein [Pseudoalteromonas sp. H105]KTF18493.1 hypothetical protein ATS75_03550 [Pseudoalteromonas sp. H105]